MSKNNLPYVDVNPSAAPRSTVIWLHGLGDSGNGFVPIVPELRLPERLAIRFVFPYAPWRSVTINNGMSMRAWYDITSLDFDDRADGKGVYESAELVEQLIDDEIASGVPAERIVLAGFSQGGVIALHLGARTNKKLAGVMSLSAYMFEAENLRTQAHAANRQTPFLIAHGKQDEVVPLFLGKSSFKELEQNGYPVQWREYEMQHSLCAEQINDISLWLQQRLA
jgi:phospholipase/carboxylesterase